MLVDGGGGAMPELDGGGGADVGIEDGGNGGRTGAVFVEDDPV